MPETSFRRHRECVFPIPSVRLRTPSLPRPMAPRPAPVRSDTRRTRPAGARLPRPRRPSEGPGFPERPVLKHVGSFLYRDTRFVHLPFAPTPRISRLILPFGSEQRARSPLFIRSTRLRHSYTPSARRPELELILSCDRKRRRFPRLQESLGRDNLKLVSRRHRCLGLHSLTASRAENERRPQVKELEWVTT